MNKYAPKKLKKGDKMWAIRYNYKVIKHKLSHRSITKTTATIEKVVILLSLKMKGTNNLVLSYDVKNDNNENYFILRKNLFVRKDQAIKSLFSSVKDLLGDNLNDFISKNKK